MYGGVEGTGAVSIMAVRVDNLEVVEEEGLGVAMEMTTVIDALDIEVMLVIEFELKMGLKLDFWLSSELELPKLEPEREFEFEFEFAAAAAAGEVVLLMLDVDTEIPFWIYTVQVSGYVAFITAQSPGHSVKRLDNGVGPPLQLMQRALRYQDMKS